MTPDPKYQPFLQIVHVSDLHVLLLSYKNRLPAFRATKRLLPKTLQFAIDQGTAPSDTGALVAFETFIKKIAREEQVWKDLPTWLVDTGDGTTFGDSDSLRKASDWLDRFETAASPAGVVRLYGNHDAWPEKFPQFCVADTIARHRDALRSKWFTKAFPQSPLSEDIPGMDSAIQLFALNSVIHDRRLNTWAFGEIRTDLHWKTPAVPSDSDTAITGMAAKARSASAGRLGRDLRILAVHHPIHYPGGEPVGQMHLLDSRKVSARLLAENDARLRPLAHLVLSGHTHGLYPAHGSLPDLALKCDHPPLARGQCQLVIGSLSQLSLAGDPWAHQCQVLRFYGESGPNDRVLMERHIASRANSMREYRFVPVPPCAGGAGKRESPYLAEASPQVDGNNEPPETAEFMWIDL